MKLTPEDFRSYTRLLAYCGSYSARIAAALACMVMSAVAGIVPPWLIKIVVDDVLIAGDRAALNTLAVTVVILSALKVSFGYGYNYLMSWVGYKLIMDIRLSLYDRIQKLSFKILYRKRMGEFVSIITNDVATLQSIMTTSAVELVVQSVTFIGIVAFLFFINWRLTLATFVVIPVAVFAIDRASAKLRAVGEAIQEQLAQLSGIAQEALHSIRIVRAFATEKHEFDRFAEKNRSHFKALIRGTQTRGFLEGVVEIVLITAMSFILWLGGRDVVAGKLTAGELISFLTYIGLLVQPVRVTSRVVSAIQQGVASADRIFGIIDAEYDVPEPSSPIVLRDMRGEIVFDDVWFAYEDERWVLRGLCLRAEPGERIAIVGATGAGKSTIGDLLLRFHDPTRGRILIDGVDLRELDTASYRRRVGVVPQDPVLMKGSISYNISYGFESADEESVRRAAVSAGIDEYVSSLPDGYGAEIGERGVTLSGGQRQRVAIARAIVRDPAILLMDEATSSLDAMVELQVQRAMSVAMSGRTSLVIAHRLSTIRDSDRILVLSDGIIAEEGRHEDLMDSRGYYFNLYSLQGGAADVPNP
ncbi:MAG: ABC transporter ATP-binding protein/permease [Synergistaceae bacterium]|jgi:subfamily B ATP-binding cassette protein MsbA|nr:ABC transporter ATP-binding protein/permease [Synergistaceae bacterium]